MKLVVYLFLFAFIHSVPLAVSANAQQTIFNVPTTDVLDRGKVYAELDLSFKPNEPRFSSFVPRIVIGTGSNFEIGLNMSGNIQPGDDANRVGADAQIPLLSKRKKGRCIDGRH